MQIDEEELPDIENVVFKRIHKKYLKVILLNFLLFSILIFTVMYFIFHFRNDTTIYNYKYYIYGVVVALLTLWILFAYIGFSRRKYAMREKDISYKSGVLIQTQTTVPFSRIQHIEMDEGLFSRFFNLASIHIFTAGASGEDLTVKGLAKEDALKIKEYITNSINE